MIAALAAVLILAVMSLRAVAWHQEPKVSSGVPELFQAEFRGYPAIALQARIAGEVRIDMTTDGARVARSGVSNAHQMLLEAATAMSQTWRFLPHTPTALEATLRFSARDADACYDRDENPHVSVRFPDQMEISGAFLGSCFSRPPAIEETRFRIPRLQGVVTCDCPGSHAIESASVSTELPTGRGIRYSGVETDGRGRFDFGNTPPGTYVIYIWAWGYSARRLLVVVDREEGQGSADLVLRRDERHKPLPPATVRSAQIAFYPEQARLQQIDGSVRVRILAEGHAEVIKGPPQLSEAAVENARTWKFVRRPERPFDVEYRYRLLPGDCIANQNPTISMRFPNEVEITAKRRIPCGPASR